MLLKSASFIPPSPSGSEGVTPAEEVGLLCFSSYALGRFCKSRERAFVFLQTYNFTWGFREQKQAAGKGSCFTDPGRAAVLFVLMRQSRDRTWCELRHCTMDPLAVSPQLSAVPRFPQ